MRTLRQKLSTVVEGSGSGHASNDVIDEDFQRLEESRACLKEITRTGAKYCKAVENEVEEGNAFLTAMKDYSNRLNAKALDPSLADSLGLAVEMLDFVLQQRRQTAAQLQALLLEPLQQFIHVDLNEGRTVKKNYDHVKQDYESINARVKDASAKSKV